jgi:hypothetical protein
LRQRWQAHEPSGVSTLALTVTYVSLVLGLDIAVENGWLPPVVYATLRGLHLCRGPSGFDWLKFVLWFAVPALWLLRSGDGVGYCLRGTKVEWTLQGGVVVASCLAMFVVASTSELSTYYLGGLPQARLERWQYVQRQLLWTLSWLPGYELLMRRLLLRRAAMLGRWSIALVAMLEFIYHLQKPMLEAVAALGFSVALSIWVRRRPTSVHPLLAHLWVELVLIGFLALR